MSQAVDNPAYGGPGDRPSKQQRSGTGGDDGRMSSRFKSFRVADLIKGASGNEGHAAQINNILQELDQNGDGVINAAELINMLDGVVKARRERRYMFFVIAALCVFCVCTVGAVVGLTYAVVDALKDTQVTGDTMYVKGSTVDVVRTGSAEFAVVDGVFVNRQAQALANATSSSAAASNTTTPSPNAVMRAAR
ncbi:hypothetical protein GPECTOR_101g21 [Gonium pectorale]|uniref:EF-hand domain-containing protein n=1 Tax=Gonium pectorale TaxID=33097 RepID=A0A150G1F2_GONPE|nr:hypothetical protein GPECTOR_101g21 [Gonium pectorale]|eukprot:KXZ43120.1 hypothetical protein GPECTOR_101g21 [Gonium pectorale]